ncbi:unnamed protein product, partial [Pleuronectes platessa]
MQVTQDEREEPGTQTRKKLIWKDDKIQDLMLLRAPVIEALVTPTRPGRCHGLCAEQITAGAPCAVCTAAGCSTGLCFLLASAANAALQGDRGKLHTARCLLHIIILTFLHRVKSRALPSNCTIRRVLFGPLSECETERLRLAKQAPHALSPMMWTKEGRTIVV